MVQKKTLLFNSISGVVQLVITALLTFVAIPVFISKLGLDVYGVFAVVSVIGNLSIFVNLGLNTALTKYIAEQGKGEDSNFDILVSFLINISTIVPISLVIYYFSDFILTDILNVPGLYIEPAKELFGFLLISNALLFIGQSFTSILDALQKMYLTNAAQLIYNIIYWLGLIVIISLGYGLKEVGMVVLASAIIWFLIVFSIFVRSWGKINVYFSATKIGWHVRKQLKYGLKMYTSGLMSFFNEPLFKIIISNMFGVAAVGYYEIAVKVRSQFNGLFIKILSPAFPFMSQQADWGYLAKLIKELTGKVFLLVVPVCAYLILICSDVVAVWLKTDVYLYSIFIIGIVVPYLLFSPTTIPIYYFFTAKSPGKTILMQSVSVLVSLASIGLFFPFLGIYTIILSNALFYFSSYLLGLYYQYKMLNISYKPHSHSIRNYVLLLGVFVLIGGIHLFVKNEWLAIALTTLFVFIATIELYKHLGIVTRDDIQRYLPNNSCVIGLFDKL